MWQYSVQTFFSLLVFCNYYSTRENSENIWVPLTGVEFSVIHSVILSGTFVLQQGPKIGRCVAECCSSESARHGAKMCSAAGEGVSYSNTFITALNPVLSHADFGTRDGVYLETNMLFLHVLIFIRLHRLIKKKSTKFWKEKKNLFIGSRPEFITFLNI